MSNSYKIMSTIERMRKVSDILVKHDPELLIKMGAPGDEYESEAISIGQILTSYTPATPKHCTDVCKRVFEISFSAKSAEGGHWEVIGEEISHVFEREKPE